MGGPHSNYSGGGCSWPCNPVIESEQEPKTPPDIGKDYTWATRIAGRYMGVMQAKAYGARNGVPGELLVRVSPTRVVAQSGIAD